MRYAEMPKRVFQAHELSDGTLQFLALAGALLSYRLPPFIALNEPENSLHPNLLPMLARLIVKAAERSQVWVVTHARDLADAIAAPKAASCRAKWCAMMTGPAGGVGESRRVSWTTEALPFSP